ncbi:hypothetical protein D3C71_1746990 [compost metagenome]
MLRLDPPNHPVERVGEVARWVSHQINKRKDIETARSGAKSTKAKLPCCNEQPLGVRYSMPSTEIEPRSLAIQRQERIHLQMVVL